MDTRIFIGWDCKQKDTENCAKDKCYAPYFVIRPGQPLDGEDTKALVDLVQQHGAPDIVALKE